MKAKGTRAEGGGRKVLVRLEQRENHIEQCFALRLQIPWGAKCSFSFSRTGRAVRLYFLTSFSEMLMLLNQGLHFE